MKELTLNSLKNKTKIEYNDGNIMLVSDISQLQGENFRKLTLDMVIMVVCLSGKAKITANEKHYTIVKNDVFICLPNVFIDDYWLSKDFDCKIIGFSNKAIDSSIYISKNVWQNLYYVAQNPILHLKDKDLKVLYYYYCIAQTKITNSKTNIYHEEIMHNLLISLIYEFLIITDRYTKGILLQSDKAFKQGDIILKRFLELLSKEKGMIRSVQQAADKLHVSNKYLSSVIKNTSGKKAMEFIHNYTLQEIIRRLKYTDKSIKEISNDMNFPSLSFFGKFVKQHSGVTPKQLRNNNGQIIKNK